MATRSVRKTFIRKKSNTEWTAVTGGARRKPTHENTKTRNRYAESQLQTRAISDLLAVQQRRLEQVNTRLDTVRRELSGTTLRIQALTQQLGAIEQTTPESLVRPGVSLADARRQLEEQQVHGRTEFESHSAQEQMLRTRESELLNQLTAEEGKWNELVGRLNEWLRR
jgi:chromosome segregation ATPase